MSDGMSEAAAFVREEARVFTAACKLRDVVSVTRDAVFGVPSWVVDTINEALKGTGVVVSKGVR